MLNMACTLFRLTPEEALAGVTVHAARALGLADRGALAPGQRADLALLGRSPSRPSSRTGSAAMPAVGIVRGGRVAHWSGMMNSVRPRSAATRRSSSTCRTRERSCRPRSRARLTPRGARAARHRLARREALRVRARAGATLMCATHSRYVVDLNRDPSGAALYPGADNTELCPTRTFANEPIYVDGRRAGAGGDRAARRARTSTRITRRSPPRSSACARATATRSLLDGHSIRSEVPRFFAGRLPDLNLGTADGASCAPSLQARGRAVLAGAAGFTHVVNGRFKGGWITRHYGRPDERRARAAARDRRSAATWTRRRRIRGTRRARRRSSRVLRAAGRRARRTGGRRA